MASQQQAWTVSRVQISAQDWVPVPIPTDCDGFGLESEQGWSWRFRTTEGDAGTEKHCYNASQEIVLATPPDRSKYPTRFRAGDVLCWVKSDEGADVLVATWVGNN